MARKGLLLLCANVLLLVGCLRMSGVRLGSGRLVTVLMVGGGERITGGTSCVAGGAISALWDQNKLEEIKIVKRNGDGDG